MSAFLCIMEILVDRFISDDDSTVSKVSVEGKFVCFGLEDEYREEKVVGETRIPAGTYKIKLRTEGGHHEKYKKRFPDIHRGMLHLQEVKSHWYKFSLGNAIYAGAGFGAGYLLGKSSGNN